MKLTDPNPGPSFEDQMAAFRSGCRIRQPGKIVPELSDPRGRLGSPPLPRTRTSDLSMVLMVKDKLRDTFRLLNSS